MRTLTPLGSMLAILLSVAPALAQSLPPPSRTVYKCEGGGKVRYSDAPCLGARKVDVEPTRGLNKSSGREQTGSDVRQEQFRENLAEGIKPLSGMSPKQFEQFGRRQRLSAEAQRECRALDHQLPTAEAGEAAASAPGERNIAHRRLLKLRTAYQTLRCE